MPDRPLVANSLAEAYLYLMATPCPACGKGPLRGADARPTKREPTLEVAIEATCGACGHTQTCIFSLPHGTQTETDDAVPVVNPTEEPSEILDVPRWLVLFRAITEAAGRTKDKQEARRLGIEAAQCLEEALKFYEPTESDLPPKSAFFDESSRERLRENPENFSRKRLLELRDKLPSLAYMRRRLREAEKAKKKKWWKFGR